MVLFIPLATFKNELPIRQYQYNILTNVLILKFIHSGFSVVVHSGQLYICQSYNEN